ncbi:MAG: type I-E CRISPR-associated protein Cas6/Cse3/CasE [Armatimonadetes bacterium]|nr:type I-E CRISPR-associated protein Cas6/Cse3/CasE [Armatimonadota bacterium]
MYLSRLILDPRSRQVRAELLNPYEMHRTLLRAFRAKRDAAGVLYRVESDRRTGVPTALVQSAIEPDWSALTQLDRYLLATDLDNPAYKQLTPAFSTGQVLQFRLRANPTVKRDGKRLGLLEEQAQAAWLARKAEGGGFRILSCAIVPEGLGSAAKHDRGHRVQVSHFAVRFDGILQVTEPDLFLRTLQSGIGPAKAFGFGLLSVAPCR